MTRKALNVIGERYNSDAILIGKAFDYADQIMRGTGAARKAYFDNGIVGGDSIAADYVKQTQADRRYRLHINASSGISDIVTYKGVRYYVEHVWDSISKSRASYVYKSHNN